MPKVIQPSGLLQKRHVRYTARLNLSLLSSAMCNLEEEGVSLWQVSKRLQVAHSLFVKWQQQQATDIDPILAMPKSRRKANCAGPLVQLKPLEDALLWYVFEQHEQGNNVTTLSLVMKASSLSPEFNAKTFIARSSAVVQFMHAHLLVYCMACTNHDSTNQKRSQRRHPITWMSCAGVLTDLTATSILFLKWIKHRSFSL
jgi:hypothetical protein